MYNEARSMADQIINTIKPILLEELTKKIKENEKQFDVVETGIDDIIKKVKNTVEPISSPIVTGIKLIPFGNPSEKLQELADDLKLKMDGIDLSELEKIPDLAPEITTRVKALPKKVIDKLKTLVDELIMGTKTADAVPTANPSTGHAATNVDTVSHVATETSVKQGLQSMSVDDKQKTIDSIMKMLEDTGILDEIKKRICVPAAVAPAAEAPVVAVEAPDVAPAVEAPVVAVEAPVVAVEAPAVAPAVEAPVTTAVTTDVAPDVTTAVAPVVAPVVAVEVPVATVEVPVATTEVPVATLPTPPVAAPPAPQKGGSRRKTKKNIRHNKRTYTKFGREF